MNLFRISVQEPYLSFIKKGIKTVEGRLNKGKFASFSIGQIIEIDGDQYTILRVKKYISFSEMLQSEGVDRVIPDVKTLEDAIQVYYKFYTTEDEMRYGVLAIEIKKI